MRRSALAYKLAGTFVAAVFLRLNAKRAMLAKTGFKGRVHFNPWPRWANPAHQTFNRKGARIYARQRMLATLAGPASEANHTRWHSAPSDAETLSYAERIGDQDQGLRWLNHARKRARSLAGDQAIKPVISAVAEALLADGSVDAGDVLRLARAVSPAPGAMGRCRAWHA